MIHLGSSTAQEDASTVGESQYLDFVVKPKGKADMEILFQAI